MARLFLTGASGFVGGRIIETAPPDWSVAGQWRSHRPVSGCVAEHQVDLSDATATARAIRESSPDVVLHAAYDMAAGVEPNLVWSRNVLAAAAAIGARVVLISTDLVFDGKRGWYAEDEEPAPVIAYGAWKATLEREVLTAAGIVARTSLVWGIDPISATIESMILAPLRRGEPPRLFADEWRTPTEVRDLAHALWLAAELKGPRILHMAGPERLSRLEQGQVIARAFGFDPDSIPASYRAEVAPDRPADTSLLATRITTDVLRYRFRGPSEILARS
ncbi:MAG: NAD-dependent epimerase/dehydratase family protein [Chloroflexota bacterium]|nr:MAG: NAD-dependent epimerase/dehydratase family protein [Chloroflexota bacterium]